MSFFATTKSKTFILLFATGMATQTLAMPFFELGGEGISGGGNAIRCDDTKLYSWDYIARALPNSEVDPDYYKAKNAKEIIEKISKKLSDYNPVMAASLEDFRLFNEDPSNHATKRLWIPGSNPLAPIGDEDRTRIPKNCIATADEHFKLYQAVARKAAGDTIYEYDSSLLKELERNSPIQLSFLYIHEWLRDYSQNTSAILYATQLFHTKKWGKPENFYLTLRRFGFSQIPEPPPALMLPDTIPAEFAYYDSVEHKVSVQGSRSENLVHLRHYCGDSGTGCRCEFSMENSQIPTRLTAISKLSLSNNAINCSLPSDLEAMHPRLVSIIEEKNGRKTIPLDILNSLTLSQILGATIEPETIRGIYQYNCNRNFFEGDGVSVNNVSCMPNQRLGLIQAAYGFYLHKSKRDSNFGSKPNDIFYPSSICGFTNSLKYSCDNKPDLRYGLASRAQSVISVAISLTSKPEGGLESMNISGYGALPDESGNCPIGLVKIRPYVAEPASILANQFSDSNCMIGTIPNPPSNFINEGSLNNILVDVLPPNEFTVTRKPNTNCSFPTGVCAPRGVNGVGVGDCSEAKFAPAFVQASYKYTALKPIICAIPKEVLTEW